LEEKENKNKMESVKNTIPALNINTTGNNWCGDVMKAIKEYINLLEYSDIIQGKPYYSRFNSPV